MTLTIRAPLTAEKLRVLMDSFGDGRRPDVILLTEEQAMQIESEWIPADTPFRRGIFSHIYGVRVERHPDADSVSVRARVLEGSGMQVLRVDSTKLHPVKYPKITIEDILIAADRLEEEGFAICQVLRDPAIAELLSRIRGRVHNVTEKTISHQFPTGSEIHHVEIEWMQDKFIDLDVQPMVFDDDVIAGVKD